MYYHASATWDEPSPEEKERAMGFQTSTTNHTKVTRLECNVLLGRGMDLNSFTWLLVTCVFFQTYTTFTDSISLQFSRCDHMACRPSTLTYLQHSTFHY